MSSSAPVRVGVAKVDITPPVGVDLSGYIARQNPSQSIHDRLYGKALALECGKAKLVIVCSDIVGFSPESIACIRKEVEARTQIPATDLLLTSIHTHSGPATLILRNCGNIIPEYVREMESMIVGAVVEAVEGLKPGRIGIAHGTVTTPFGYNRRKVQGGLLDPDLTVLRVDDEQGAPVATWINFTCHPVVLSHLNVAISGDFPAEVTSLVEQQVGGVALFSNGACGDINPFHGDFTVVTNVATPIAQEAVRLRSAIQTSDVGSILIESQEMEIPFAPLPGPEKAEQDLQMRKQVLSSTTPGDMSTRIALASYSAAASVVDLLKKDIKTPPPLKADLKLVQIGDFFLVSFPGEVLVAIGLRLKEVAPGRVTFVGYSDGCLGYIPLQDDFSMGGYEPGSAWIYYGYSAPFASGIGEQLIERATEMIRRRL